MSKTHRDTAELRRTLLRFIEATEPIRLETCDKAGQAPDLEEFWQGILKSLGMDDKLRMDHWSIRLPNINNRSQWCTGIFAVPIEYKRQRS
jgi:hypothetical protein